MNLAKSIKRAVRKTPWLIEPITRWRGRRLERYMRAEEAYYAARCTGGSLEYSFESSRRLLAERLRGRDLSPKPVGAVNVFALFTDGGWEYEHWPRAWDGIGRVEYLDWRANGFDERSPGWGPEQRRRLSDFVVDRVRKAHRRSPLDVFFAHVSADVLEPRAIQAIAAMGIFTFNLGLDDLSACFRGGRPTDERPGGPAGLASGFDLNVPPGPPAWGLRGLGLNVAAVWSTPQGWLRRSSVRSIHPKGRGGTGSICSRSQGIRVCTVASESGR